MFREGEFEFIEKAGLPEEAVALKISAANIIYREVKKTADAEFIKKYFLDSRVDFSSTPLDLFQDIRLTKTDRTIISFVDGKTSIADIARLSPCDKKDALKSIYALLETRILEIRKENEIPSGIKHEELFDKSQEGRDDLIRRIEYMHSRYLGMDYFDVLGLDHKASYEEIKKAYYKKAKEFHPDLHFSLIEDMKRQLLEIFTYITNAYLNLIDPVKRKEYERSLAVKEARFCATSDVQDGYYVFERDLNSKAHERVPQLNPEKFVENSEIALYKFNEGRNKFRNMEYEEASRLFATAIYFDASFSKYHYFYGCSLEMCRNFKEAVKALNRALEINPSNSDALAELGHVYFKIGLPLRAKGYFDKAIKLEPSNKRAREGLKILGKKDKKD